MFLKPKKIGSMEIKNRFVRSATFEGMATEDGYITDKHLKLYKDLAKGGVGLIITGITYVHESGRSSRHMNSIIKPRINQLEICYFGKQNQ